ncbi:urea carboxylase-associated family protein [Kribbella yunnanensis]|uniref:Urea carboxylase-associated family protein n=1 Tax=Kribbella yunnanensis TaxID=190194 RepID=A0ABN2IKT2_9ACTN
MKHEIPGDAALSIPVRTGRALTLTALADNANASVLIIGPDRLDRLNIPDTLKSQMTARIHAGLVLMSDRGLALATVTASTLDWHDCLTGFISSHLLLLELRKHGLGEADLHGPINFFTKIGIDTQAGLAFVPGHATVGDSVTIRAEQDLLVFISTAPHPFATSPAGAVGVQVGPAEADDPDGLRPEALRALELVR